MPAIISQYPRRYAVAIPGLIRLGPKLIHRFRHHRQLGRQQEDKANEDCKERPRMLRFSASDVDKRNPSRDHETDHDHGSADRTKLVLSHHRKNPNVVAMSRAFFSRRSPSPG